MFFFYWLRDVYLRVIKPRLSPRAVVLRKGAPSGRRTALRFVFGGNAAGCWGLGEDCKREEFPSLGWGLEGDEVRRDGLYKNIGVYNLCLSYFLC